MDGVFRLSAWPKHALNAAAVFWPLMILVEKENHNSDAEKLIVWALPAGLVSEWSLTTFAAI